jgi:hypothetical protein
MPLRGPHSLQVACSAAAGCRGWKSHHLPPPRFQFLSFSVSQFLVCLSQACLGKSSCIPCDEPLCKGKGKEEPPSSLCSPPMEARQLHLILSVVVDGTKSTIRMPTVWPWTPLFILSTAANDFLHHPNIQMLKFLICIVVNSDLTDQVPNRECRIQMNTSKRLT